MLLEWQNCPNIFEVKIFRQYYPSKCTNRSKWKEFKMEMIIFRGYYPSYIITLGYKTEHKSPIESARNS
jgi:hypothetical protein